MRLLSFLFIFLSLQVLGQTIVHRRTEHMIAILDQEDSRTLYSFLNVAENKTENGLIKTLGPEDKIVHVSCQNLNEDYSCIFMLKLYNLKEQKLDKTGFYLASEIDKDKVDSWYEGFNIPNQDFGDSHFFKEFLSHDKATYFNCRSHNRKKTCKLGILL